MAWLPTATPGCAIRRYKGALDCGVTHLVLRDEPEALVKVGQGHEVTVDEVDDRLNDAVPLL